MAFRVSGHNARARARSRVRRVRPPVSRCFARWATARAGSRRRSPRRADRRGGIAPGRSDRARRGRHPFPLLLRDQRRGRGRFARRPRPQERPVDSPVNVQEAERPLYANMIVERLPWVMPEPPAWETEYREWSEARGARFLKELPEELVNPKGEFEETESDAEAAFQPADRVTDADRSGDVRTLHRKLDEFLFLVVQDGATGRWGFPREVNDETGKTIRESAKAAMDAAVGDSIETFLVGNAPLGHWEERRAGGRRPPRSGEGGRRMAAKARASRGAARGPTYLRAQWLDGDLRLEQRYKDHMWLTKVRRVGRAALVRPRPPSPSLPPSRPFHVGFTPRTRTRLHRR